MSAPRSVVSSARGPSGSLVVSIKTRLFRMNHSQLWHRSVRLGERRYRAPTADRLLALWLHRVGLLGRQEAGLFARLVRPGMHVADIGANQGLFTVLLSRLVGDAGTVLACEPEPHLFGALVSNCEVNGARNVRALAVALGEQDGTAILHRSPLHSGDNRLVRYRASGTGVEVPVRRLDSLVSGGLDFVKIDVQGHELVVLRGMERALARSPSLTIHLEVWPHGLRSAGTRPADLVAFLADQGFRLLDPATRSEGSPLEWETRIARLTGRRFTNVLASRATAP